jgi:hypothetical protein
MKKQIFCTITIEGLHHWNDCNIDEVKYLKDLHRHLFQIKCIKTVSHNDRDIEFIKLKHEVESFIKESYFDNYFNCCNFKNLSCESIAEILINKYNLDQCEVSEDGENGSIVKVL